MSAARRVFVHIGLKKTGTTYLQGVLFGSRDQLSRQGLDLLPGTRLGAFQLMLAVRGRLDPEVDPSQAWRALPRFAEDLLRAPGSRALFTEESLAATNADHIDRLREACGEREIHLVLTVRDLARQIPSAWQQQVKAGRAVRFADFVEELQARRSTAARKFWGTQDLPSLLERWARFAPPERTHIVTVGQRGAPPDQLLRRFCDVLEVDPSALNRPDAPSNTSLGLVQAELLARVNGLIPADARTRDAWGTVVKRDLAERVLAAQAGPPAQVPTRWRGWCVEVAQQQIDAVRARPYQVVGDLAELIPDPSSFAANEQLVESDALADAATAALAALAERRLRGHRHRRTPSGETDRRPASLLTRLRDRLSTGRRR